LHRDRLAVGGRGRHRGGEIGLYAEVLVEAHQIAVNEFEDARGGECRDLVGVEVGHLAGAREDERSALLGLVPARRRRSARGRWRAGGDDRCKDQSYSSERTLQHGPSPGASRTLAPPIQPSVRRMPTASTERSRQRSGTAARWRSPAPIRIASPGPATSGTCLELDAKLALEHQKELVGSSDNASRHRAFPTPRVERKPRSPCRALNSSTRAALEGAPDRKPACRG